MSFWGLLGWGLPYFVVVTCLAGALAWVIEAKWP